MTELAMFLLGAGITNIIWAILYWQHLQEDKQRDV